MSHRHADEEIQTTIAQNSDSGIRRPQSHSHLNLNPAHVIDQIKTKVKRKRPSNKLLLDAPTTAVDDSCTEMNESPAQLGDKQDRLQPASSSLSKAQSQPNITLDILSSEEPNAYQGNRSTDEKNASTENILTVTEKSGKEDSHFLSIPQDKPQASSDTETNKKKSKSKSKSRKESKALLELESQVDTKEKRAKSRQTVQSTPKKRKSKENKGDGREGFETLPYLASFQIRDEDFNNIFGDLPADEPLIVAYPCIWRKDMFTHGRIFLSLNYVCFYTCFFKWDERVCIALKDIDSIKREKSVKVLSNAIRLRIKSGEEYIFASFAPRERVFTAICRQWQNALSENPVSYQQLRASILAETVSGDESSPDSEQSVRLVNSVKRPLEPNSESQSISPVASNGSVLASTLSDGVESDSYRSTCSCDSHLARTCAERTFPYHVDKLYELIFEDNAFSRAYHDSQKLIDFNLGEWRVQSETGKRVRQTTYKIATQSILGTNTITCTEKQTMETEVPHSLYVVSTEVYNEGVKYTDSFYVATKYCMFQRDAKHCGLRLTAEIRYIKNVNGLIKSFIERNCNTSIDEGLANLVRRLESQQAGGSHRKAHQKPPSAVPKEHVQKKDECTTTIESKTESQPENVAAPHPQVLVEAKTVASSRTWINIALFLGVFLLVLHIYLCYKLHSIDELLHKHSTKCLNRCRKSSGANKALP